MGRLFSALIFNHSLRWRHGDTEEAGVSSEFQCARLERWAQASRPVILNQYLLRASVPPAQRVVKLLSLESQALPLNGGNGVFRFSLIH